MRIVFYVSLLISAIFAQDLREMPEVDIPPEFTKDKNEA